MEDQFLMAARCRAWKIFRPCRGLVLPNGNHGLQPWLRSDAAPRLLSSHPEFLEIGSSATVL